MSRHPTPIVPDFTPVTAEQVRDHWNACPDCQGCSAGWCEEGKALLARFQEQNKAERNRAANKQVNALTDAGWRCLIPENLDAHDRAPGQFYWRAPSRGRGSPGRLYRSTNQAWRAMMRASGVDVDREEHC